MGQVQEHFSDIPWRTKEFNCFGRSPDQLDQFRGVDGHFVLCFVPLAGDKKSEAET